MLEFDAQCFYLCNGIDDFLYTSLYSDPLGRIYVSRYDSQWQEGSSGTGWDFITELMYYQKQKNQVHWEQFIERVDKSSFPDKNRYYLNPQNYANDYDLEELITVSDTIGYSSSYFGVPTKYPTDPWSTWIGPAVMMNGSLVRFDDAKPYIANDRTMIPMRKLFELLGAEIEWNDQTKTVTSTLDGNKVTLTIGQNTMYVNDREVVIDAPAQVNYDRTYVPLRAISEALNATIEWDGTNKVVYIQQ